MARLGKPWHIAVRPFVLGITRDNTARFPAWHTSAWPTGAWPTGAWPTGLRDDGAGRATGVPECNSVTSCRAQRGVLHRSVTDV